jgi:hypothetical protein
MSITSIAAPQRIFLSRDGRTLFLGGGQFAPGENSDPDGGEKAAEEN